MNKLLNIFLNEHTDFLSIYILHLTNVGSIGHKRTWGSGQMLGNYKGRELGST